MNVKALAAAMPMEAANDCLPFFKQEFANYKEKLDLHSTPQAARFTLEPYIERQLDPLTGEYERIEFEDPNLFEVITLSREALSWTLPTTTSQTTLPKTSRT